ncbi:hypothetical protein [uncultured Nostoc sp.]|uniref:hypothetical protein n=1 Tax=uncultured Nostoc sp. TaxID=340711 RepID=UPI0035CC27D1
MSDNKTDTPRNSFIFLISFIVFALFIISSVMVAYFVWDISPSDERLKNEMEANLQEANLRGGENLEQHQIELAKGDRTTILPGNLQPPKHWKAQVSAL